MIKGIRGILKKGAGAGHCDFPLTVMVTVLVIFGVVMIFSASYYYSINMFGTPYQYLKDQIFNAGLGFVLMWIASKIDYRIFRRLAFPILKELEMPAVVFPIGISVGKDTYKDTEIPITPHFTWEQAVEMANSGLISLQSHTYDLHQKTEYETASKSLNDAALVDIAAVGRICSLEALGRFDEALEAILSLEPTFKASAVPHYLFPELLLAKARILCQKGDKSGAKQTLEPLLAAEEGTDFAKYRPQAERTVSMIDAYVKKSLFEKAPAVETPAVQKPADEAK